jgi:hypothetical protein
MVATIHSRGRPVVNGQTTSQRRARGFAGLLVQLCILAVLVPIFASRGSGDPLRLVIVAFGAIALLVVLLGHNGFATRRAGTPPVDLALPDDRGFEHLPLGPLGRRREFVVRLGTSTFEEAHAHILRAQETMTSRSTGTSTSSDVA